VHAVLCVDTLRRESVTVDEVGHLPAGLSYWQQGTFGLYHHNPPLVKLVAALPALAAGAEVDYSGSWRQNLKRNLPQSPWVFGREFMYGNAARYHDIYFWARLSIVAFSLLTGIVVFLWSRMLFGRAAAFLALAFWTVSPNPIAHAGLVTTDAGAIALGFVATFVFWLYLRRPGWGRALAAGSLLGAAQLVKFTLLLLFPLWLLLAVGWAFFSRARAPETGPSGGSAIRKTVIPLAHGGLMLVVAVFILNAGYGFEGTGRALGDYVFLSRTLTRPRPAEATPVETPPGYVWAHIVATRRNRFQDTWLDGLPVPLPYHYVAGFDEQKLEAEGVYGHGYPVYLCGELRQTGWWYYYLVALGLKIPLGTFLLTALAVLAAIAGPAARTRRATELVLLAPPLVLVLVLSFLSDINLGVRYVLPALPFWLVAVSRVGACLAPRPGRGGAGGSKTRWRRWLTAGTVLALAINAAALRHHPHHLAYFNELAGGPAGGDRYLVDSNLDWGQDLLGLQAWMKRNRPGETVGLAYFGNVDPAILAAEGRPLAFTLAPPRRLEDTTMDFVGRRSRLNRIDPRRFQAEMKTRGETDVRAAMFRMLGHRVGPHPGLFAVSANFVHGLPFRLFDEEGNAWRVGNHAYSYFSRFPPIARVGYSIYIYEIGSAEAERVRRELGLTPLHETSRREAR
jgi:hypothetical protein